MQVGKLSVAKRAPATAIKDDYVWLLEVAGRERIRHAIGVGSDEIRRVVPDL
jgi:hypothetical protein